MIYFSQIKYRLTVSILKQRKQKKQIDLFVQQPLGQYISPLEEYINKRKKINKIHWVKIKNYMMNTQDTTINRIEKKMLFFRNDGHEERYIKKNE